MKVAVLQCGGIGDLILTLPLVRRLRMVMERGTVIHLYTSRRAEGMHSIIANADECLTGVDCWLEPKGAETPPPDLRHPWSEPLPGNRFPIKALRRWWRMMRWYPKDSGYDLAFDVRGDWRYGLVLWRAGIPVRVRGNRFGHAGPWGTHKVPFRGQWEHETDAAMRLADAVGLPYPMLHQNGLENLFNLPYHNEDKVKQRLRRLGLKKPPLYVMPNSGGVGKAWPDGKWVALLRSIPATVQAVLLGKSNLDKACNREIAKLVPDAVDATGEFTLPETALLFGTTRGRYVGLDTGLSHLAAALGLRTVSLHADQNDPRRWAPRGPRAKALGLYADHWQVWEALFRAA